MLSWFPKDVRIRLTTSELKIFAAFYLSCTTALRLENECLNYQFLFVKFSFTWYISLKIWYTVAFFFNHKKKTGIIHMHIYRSVSSYEISDKKDFNRRWGVFFCVVLDWCAYFIFSFLMKTQAAFFHRQKYNLHIIDFHLSLTLYNGVNLFRLHGFFF